jgi:hypothetical protein
VDKTREAWKLPEVEVVFDYVQGAGCFVEFEFKSDAANTDGVTGVCRSPGGCKTDCCGGVERRSSRA